MSHQTAIALPHLTPSAPRWSSLLIGAAVMLAAPAVALPNAQVAAATEPDHPRTGIYLSQSMPSSMPDPLPDSMPSSMPHSMPDAPADSAAASQTSFQRINQPLGVKAVVTVGGLIVMAGELWWFLGHHARTDS